MKRVVITGMGAVSPFGQGVEKLFNGLIEGKSGIQKVEALEGITGLTPTIAGLIPEYDAKSIPRKFRRTMSPMSIFATLAAQEAITQSGVTENMLANGRIGLSISSTVGSVQALQSFFESYLKSLSIEGIKSTEFFKIMNHSCASNLAQRFGITGRVLAPSAACSTGSQTIGLAAEAIAMGKQDFMLCGGTDELHPLTVGTFDIIQAASTSYNEMPEATPRPFDANRDGIVCSEGAGMLLIESLESAKTRGAKILAEIIGFATNSDPSNLANPNIEAIRGCMESALKDANLAPNEIDYVNAHATGTRLGDAAECSAIKNLIGKGPLVSSLKGHLGHTMAACGAIELIATISMMHKRLVIPTRNLVKIAPECTGIHHVLEPETTAVRTILKNNFALGGINTSIILRRYND